MGPLENQCKMTGMHYYHMHYEHINCMKNHYGLWGMREYGLWVWDPCEPPQEIENSMGYEGVWVITGMCYVGVDCILFVVAFI